MVYVTANVSTNIQAATSEGKWCTVYSFRVRGAASNSMDGIAVEVCMQYVGA